MKLTTAEREKALLEAVGYYHSHNGPIPAQKVAAKFRVSHMTLGNRIAGKSRPITSNGGHNKLLSEVQLGAVFLYIQRQAFAGFQCTMAMIHGAVMWIRAQNDKQPPSPSWSKKFMSKNGPILQGGIHKIKWKPMDAKRRAAQQPIFIIHWFEGLKRLREQH
jgi:hypothetical protein